MLQATINYNIIIFFKYKAYIRESSFYYTCFVKDTKIFGYILQTVYGLKIANETVLDDTTFEKSEPLIHVCWSIFSSDPTTETQAALHLQRSQSQIKHTRDNTGDFCVTEM